MKKFFSFILKIICGFLGIFFFLCSWGAGINCILNTSEAIPYLILTLLFFIIGVLLSHVAFKKEKINSETQIFFNSATTGTCQLNTNNTPAPSPTIIKNYPDLIAPRYKQTNDELNKSSDIKPRPQHPNCNCNGCSRQNVCEYGYIIYDEFTKERLTLADKFIMLNTFEMNSFKPNTSDAIDIIQDIQDLYDTKRISTYPKDVIQNTLFYLQEEKKLYLAFGKCGRAYFNFMGMNGPINNLKSILKVGKTQAST